MNDEKYMKLCLELAKKGHDKVKPNPKVGCVIVKNNRILGKGYHKYFGGPHAEIYAIKEAGKKCKNAIMYVNLEPCCHENKKTPPCVPKIISSGIKKVIIGMRDPNPEVDGKGIKEIIDNGIECKTGILENESMELNKYYIKWITKKLPYVIIKSAMSIDGKIATYTGDSKWITSDKSINYVHKLRTEVDAVLIGINTIIKDNPVLTSHNKGKNPIRILIDTKLDVPMNANILNNQSETIIITATEEKNNRKLDFLSKKNIDIIFLNKSKYGIIDFKEIMTKLFKKSIYSVLIEGGGITNAYALNSGIVDEIFIFIAPKIIGGKDAPTPVEGPGIKKLSEAIHLNKITVKSFGDDILINGKILYKN